MIRKPVYIVERDDGDIISVCDNKGVAENIANMANSLARDDGSTNIQALVTKWIINEVPDFLMNRTYYVTITEDDIEASLVEFVEDYPINVIHGTPQSMTVFVHAESSNDAKMRAAELAAGLPSK